MIGHYCHFRCQRSLKTQPLKVEINGFKTGHYLGVKTALIDPITAGPQRHVECPEREPADDDIWFSRSRMVSAR
jgi:hypothetical protein